MKNKKFLGRLLALSMCVTLAFSTPVFAKEAEEGTAQVKEADAQAAETGEVTAEDETKKELPKEVKESSESSEEKKEDALESEKVKEEKTEKAGEAEESEAVLGYTYLDAQGASIKKEIRMNIPKGSTYGELKKEFLKNAPEVPAYKGLKFQSWKILGSNSDEDIIADSVVFMSAKAVYDKKVVTASVYYPTKAGTQGHLEKGITLEAEEQYADFLKKVQDEIRPSDMSTEYEFEKWEGGNSNSALENFDTISFNAKYKGKKFISITKGFYDKNGWYTAGHVLEYKYADQTEARITKFVDENATYGALKSLVNKEELPKMYAGLKFKEWSFDSVKDVDVIPNGDDSIFMKAVYNNCIVRYMFDTDKDGLVDSVACVVVNKGGTLTFPKELEGYEAIEWGEWVENKPGDTFKVEGDMTFTGSAVKKPTNPEVSFGGKLPAGKVNEVVKDLNNMAAGEKHSPINIKMGDAKVISKEILKAAKGKDVDVKLDMGGYTWTINGKDITAVNLKDINLEVKRNTNTIPSKVIKQLAGNNPVEQLSLTHNGEFGFTASLTINVGSRYAGKYANLFYYNKDGKMVFMNAGKINPDGTVSLEFSHASEYLVPITDEPMAQSDVPAALQPNGNNGVPKTGDTLPIMSTVMMLFAAAAVMAFYGVKSKKNR